MVDVNHIKRSRYCMQVALNSLYLKLVDAVKNDRSELSPLTWLEAEASSNDMCYLLLVRSHEFANGNPHLYSIHERGRFRPLRRMPEEFIEMVLCTGSFQLCTMAHSSCF